MQKVVWFIFQQQNTYNYAGDPAAAAGTVATVLKCQFLAHFILYRQTYKYILIKSKPYQVAASIGWECNRNNTQNMDKSTTCSSLYEENVARYNNIYVYYIICLYNI